MKHTIKSALFASLAMVLALSPAAHAANRVALTPVLNCVQYVDYGDNTGQWFAHFGYTNTSKRTIEVAVGSNNMITPNSIYVEAFQPTTFEPGVHDFVLYVGIEESVTWTLAGKTIVATAASKPCN